jgi:uncharacterized membrane protein SpoIIM required for sporulation
MLEQLFNLKSIKGSSINIILLGVIYAFIGIFSSFMLFPHYVSIMSLAFTTILLIPSIAYLLQKEENIIAKESRFSVRNLLRDHKDIIRLYLLLFLGIFLAFCAIGVFTSNAYVENYFDAQLRVAGITGQAISTSSELAGILFNNLLVLFICFVLSLAYGSGSLLFIVWNASVWGIVFGYFVRLSIALAGADPFTYFLRLFLPFLPHMITEASSYIVAAIVGGVIAKAIVREKLFSKKFYHILTDGLWLAVFGFVLIVVAAVIEVFVFPLFL